MRRFFDRSLALAAKAGIPKDVIILDPGIGFGKTSRQNVEAVARIPDLKDYGLPILVGASRKAFLGSLTGDGIEATLIGTVAANLVAAAAGASIFRVHDVAEHVAALRIFHAHARRSSAAERVGHQLRQSVSCFSSMANTAPAFTSTSLTMQTRPILSASLTS